jgi:VanZ family protein
MRLAFRLALGVCVLAIAYLAFAPVEQTIETFSDKLNHVLAFTVLAWLVDRAYPGHHLAPYKWALLLGYGLTIEVVQGFLPYRELSVADFAADALGILCYTVAARLAARPRHTRVIEHRR